MNLHAIASAAIGVVNPNVPATLRASTGYVTDSDYKQVPSYAADAAVTAQVQDLSQRDIQHLNALNVQGSQKTIYLSGEVAAIQRVNQKGGDLILVAGNTWLTTAVIEQWPDWCRVSVTQQLDA